MTINSVLLTVLVLHASQLDKKMQQGIITCLFNGLKDKMFIFKEIRNLYCPLLTGGTRISCFE